MATDDFDNGGFLDLPIPGATDGKVFILLGAGAGWPVFNMHTMAGLMNGGSVEFHVATGYMGSVLFDNTPGPENNRVKIPDAPGLGFEANHDVLKDTLIEAT